MKNKAFFNRDLIPDEHSGVDGDLVKYAVEYSTMEQPDPNVIESHRLERDMTDGEFYDASGEANKDHGGDDFYDATGESDGFAEDYMPDSKAEGDGDDFSNFTLISKAKRKKLGAGLKKFGQGAGKFALAAASALAAGSAVKNNTNYTPSKPSVTPKKRGWAGLSTIAKVAIVGASLAGVGTIIYFVTRKKK